MASRRRRRDPSRRNILALAGPLPDWSAASALVELNVPGCGFHGKLPARLPPRLETLVLGTKGNTVADANSFEGGLPAGWADHDCLRLLTACGVGLTVVEHVPGGLKEIDLRDNPFTDAAAARKVLKKRCKGLVKV